MCLSLCSVFQKVSAIVSLQLFAMLNVKHHIDHTDKAGEIYPYKEVSQEDSPKLSRNQVVVGRGSCSIIYDREPNVMSQIKYSTIIMSLYLFATLHVEGLIALYCRIYRASLQVQMNIFLKLYPDVHNFSRLSSNHIRRKPTE